MNKRMISASVLIGTMFFIVFVGTTAVSASVNSGEESTSVATVPAEPAKASGSDNALSENNGTVQDEKKAEETVSAAVTEEKPDKNETSEPVQATAVENADKAKESKSDQKTGDSAAKAGDKDVNGKKAKKVEAANVTVIDGLVLSDAERRVYDLTNAERRKRGLPVLRLERRLMESARRQANWMARTGIFQHSHSGFAENIAMGQRSSLDVVIAWMNSSGHRRNMLNSGHGAIGIGSYRGRNGALYWCQQFSR